MHRCSVYPDKCFSPSNQSPRLPEREATGIVTEVLRGPPIGDLRNLLGLVVRTTARKYDAEARLNGFFAQRPPPGIGRIFVGILRTKVKYDKGTVPEIRENLLGAFGATGSGCGTSLSKGFKTTEMASSL